MGVYKYDSTNDELNPIAGSTTYADLAVGSIIPYGGTTPPISFLMCDGLEVPKADYPELYAVIGDAFGSAAEATHFKLPDLRECVPVGVGKNITKSIANHDRYNLGQFKDDELGTHDHPLKTVTTATYNTAGVPVGVAVNNTPTSATHGKQVGVNYIIKAKNTGCPSDIGDAVEDLVEDLMDDYQTKDLATPITIGGVSKTTVEDALSAIVLDTFESSEVVPQGSDADDFYCGLVRAGDYSCAHLPTSRDTSSGQLYYTVFTCRESNTPSAGAWTQGVQMAVVTSGARNIVYTRVINGTTISSWKQLQTDDTYSTSETLTNKVWIDGKPIYRKVFSGNFGSSANADLNLISLNIENITNVEWIGWHNNGNAVQLPYYFTSADQGYFYYVTNNASGTTGHLYMRCGSLFANQKYTFTLEYTKTS